MPSASSPVSGRLDGIRVLDSSSVIMGSYATDILADMGADVVNVEPPDGDSFRNYGAMRHEGMGGSVLNLHRNKRGIVLDLKDATRIEDARLPSQGRSSLIIRTL